MCSPTDRAPLYDSGAGYRDLQLGGPYIVGKGLIGVVPGGRGEYESQGGMYCSGGTSKMPLLLITAVFILTTTTSDFTSHMSSLFNHQLICIYTDVL